MSWGRISKIQAINQTVQMLLNDDISAKDLQVIYRKVYWITQKGNYDGGSRSEETVVDNKYNNETLDWACINQKEKHDVYGSWCGNHLENVKSPEHLERLMQRMKNVKNDPDTYCRECGKELARQYPLLVDYIREYGVWVNRDKKQEVYPND